ncbi:MAG TPA: serine/threonine-protein kinase, partial [Candidatus Thermoplasmatota archaeon]|nr:serine/threonine-protein kinase [Candidatus Thermoplasmatota archaeon]
LAGRPQDGDRLEGLRAFAYESAEPLPVPMRGAPPPGLVDATPAGAGYVVGPDEYAIPADVVAALLRDGPLDALQAAALRRVDDLKGPAPLVVAGVALAGAGGAAWWMLRARAAASPYVTVRVLGRGANGRVVLARHRVLGHHVAIKEAWTDGAAPEARERVLREARTLARFSHPNVVRVLDIREEAQGLSIVMEHVAGGSLEARLRDGEPLPLDDALRAWRDVLRGLEAAHGLGIVHRDVKPANVLLTPEGDAKLGDFGLARAVHDATLDGEGAGLAGTPTYMAPEQIRGDAPTPASDVFAAGALAYRLLSGRALVDTSRCRTPWDVLVARQAAGPALPLPGVPPPVNELLAACLDDDPDRRPVAAAALRTLEDVTGAGRR